MKNILIDETLRNQEFKFIKMYCLVGSIAYVLWGYAAKLIDNSFYDGILIRAPISIGIISAVLCIDYLHLNYKLSKFLINVCAHIFSIHFFYLIYRNPFHMLYYGGFFVTIISIASALTKKTELIIYATISVILGWILFYTKTGSHPFVIVALELSIFSYFYMGYYFKDWLIENLIANVKEKEVLIKAARQAAHDVRSPLSALNLILASNGMKMVPQEEKKIIKLSISRIQIISEDLLERNRETKSIQIALKKFDVIDSINELIEEKLIVYKDVNIQFYTNTNNFILDGNKADFQRALSNILNNSYESKPKDCKIEVDFSAYSEKKFDLNIIDNGPGMDEDIASIIFSQEVLTKKRNSSGIGLYGAHHLLSNLGLIVKLKSSNSNGTTISISRN